MSVPTRLAELEEERAFLLGSLRDLERERDAGDLDDGDYRALHDDYTARAAAVIREIEELNGGPAPATGRPRAGSARGRTSKRVAVLAVVGVLALTAVAGMVQTLTARAPGDPVTGGIDAGIATRLARAHAFEAQGEAVEALKLYDSVLRDDPANVEALAYRGWLLRLAGLADRAQASLDLAVSIDPAYPDARFFRGMLLYRDRGDPAAAVPDFEAFLAANPPPEVAEMVRGVLERARAEAQGGAG